MSDPTIDLPAIRAARDTRDRWAAENARRESRRVPAALWDAAQAFGGWYDTLRGELGRTPTNNEQADRFDQMAKTLVAQVEQHAGSDFWSLLADDPAGETLRLLLAPPRTQFRKNFLALLGTDDSLAFNAPLYARPALLGQLVEDYFTLRALPTTLTLTALQEWLRSDRLSLDGRLRLAVMRPAVGELKSVLEEASKSRPEFEFTPRGVDALVERYLVHVHKGTREEYLALSVEEVLKRIEKGPPKRKKGGEPPEGDKGTGGEQVPHMEAEVRVQDYLKKTAAADLAKVTRDAIAAATGVSTGGVSMTAAWRVFIDQRKATKTPSVKTVPLTGAMLAVIPDKTETPTELDELIQEQAKDAAEDRRRHARRHTPS